MRQHTLIWCDLSPNNYNAVKLTLLNTIVYEAYDVRPHSCLYIEVEVLNYYSTYALSCISLWYKQHNVDVTQATWSIDMHCTYVLYCHSMHHIHPDLRDFVHTITTRKYQAYDYIHITRVFCDLPNKVVLTVIKEPTSRYR